MSGWQLSEKGGGRCHNKGGGKCPDGNCHTVQFFMTIFDDL